MNKICIKCGEVKDESLFYKNRNDCKFCNINRIKEYYHKNKEIINENRKEYSKEYREKNKNKIIEKSRKKYKEYYEKNKEKYHISGKKYREKNKDKIKKYHAKHEYEKKHNNIDFKIIANLRTGIINSIKRDKGIKINKSKELIGCSIDFLKQHLQETAIRNGYLNFDINNFSGQQYHIDHIIPCNAFNLKCNYHQKLCFNWSNLQILTANENLKKSNKYDNC
jgi:hypothetical protein